MVVTFLFYSIHIYIYLFFPTGLHFLKDALSGKTRILQQTEFDRKLPKTLKPPDTKRDFNLCVCFFFFSPVVVILSLHVFCISLQDIIHM